jgi:FemAB-related protein (PEP-CTERM system-associated)
MSASAIERSVSPETGGAGGESMGASSEPIRVRPFSEQDRARWDQFVQHSPEATFFHRAAWKDVLERAYGHRTFFLVAETGEKLRGILPLAQIRSRLFGNALISTPFCVYGGAIGDSLESRRALEDEAVRIAQRLGVDYLELRHRRGRLPDWPGKDLYVTFRRRIDSDPEKNLLSIPRKQRAMVRKGIKAGLRSEIDTTVDRLYPAYATSVRNLGTPVFPKKYFRILKEVFGHDCEILTVLDGDTVVSSVMSFFFRDEVLPYYGGGTIEARNLKANDFMYWEVMRRAAERGMTIFDYGRSKRDSGSYHFKKNWGFEPETMRYEYRLVRSTSVPEINPLNPRYRLFIDLWKKLPLPVSRLIGPIIARNLG